MRYVKKEILEIILENLNLVTKPIRSNHITEAGKRKKIW